LTARVVSYYVNGSPVFTGAASLDGRYSLYSAADAGSDLLLFNEGDASGTYTHALYLSSVAFTDRTMTASELQALGGPSDLGIFVQTLPRLSIARIGQNLSLSWRGGPGIRLQKSSGPAATWLDVPGTVGTSSFSETVIGDGGFYRLTR